ncbi:hypothetical protein B0181_09910 [Moraxella caviae]|uniref:Uncharacterized protein n=1 Tax=Moraxella caviae TaxID=34060 RepID=A0A1S9ZWF9_9GAMM|nr:hypothetical protein B0181_09910 [Moraxella caviae]
MSRGLLNVLLVFVESAITLVLRFDPELRRLAYPLAEKSKVVCIRTYLPHTQLYATFSHRGVLLDNELAAGHNADITINAYSFQLVNALMGHNPDHIDVLQMRGDTQDVQHLKAFMTRLGVGGVIQNVLNKVRGNPKDKPTPEQKAQKLSDYREQINEQAQQINALDKDNRRLKTQLAELENKQKATFKGMVIACVLALIFAIATIVLGVQLY